MTDFPSKRFKKNQQVLLVSENEDISFEAKILTARKSKDRYVVTFENILTLEQAERYVGFQLLIDKKIESLPKGFYYHDDLLGCQVFDEGMSAIGLVSKVEDYPAHRTLRISRDEAPDVLVPFIAAFIKDVNIKKKEIVVKIINGML